MDAYDPSLENGSNSNGIAARAKQKYEAALIRKSWVPWLILSVLVFVWGLPQWKKLMDGIFVVKFPVTLIHNLIERVPPVVPAAKAEAAVYVFNILSATGTGILIAAFISALFMGMSLKKTIGIYGSTIIHIRYSLLTVAHSGIDTRETLQRNPHFNSLWKYDEMGNFCVLDEIHENDGDPAILGRPTPICGIYAVSPCSPGHCFNDHCLTGDDFRGLFTHGSSITKS